MNIINKTLSAISAATLLALSTMSYGQTTAITNATVHTATSQGILKNAVVIIKDGVISAINPKQINADTLLDAKGQVLTPGIIATMNTLGLVEVSAVAMTRDASDEKADINFDVSLAFNPKTATTPYARKGGITTAVIAPQGGKSIFAGQTSAVSLSGEHLSVVQANNAVFVKLGATAKGSRATGLQTLIRAFEDVQKKIKKNRTAKKENIKELDRKELALDRLLKREQPLIVELNRASDLLQLIKIKRRFNLDVAVVGAGDAVTVADVLADANIAVIINPIENLPRSFDNLSASLENAGKLAKAGVKVLLTDRSKNNMYQLRFLAGNAISYGMTEQQALKALTANAAEVFRLNSGTIAVGKTANLVLWQGDMFDHSGYVDKMWINGKLTTTESRHDKLRDRYMKKTDKPAAYSK